MVPPGVTRLSVVVPVYNERQTLREILDRVQAVSIPKEIVIVDDGSTDGTREWLQGLEAELAEARQAGALDEKNQIRVFYQERNQGKGAALRRGFAEATGDIIVIQDADLEYEPQDLPRLLAPIVAGQAQVVYGVRSFEGQRWYMNLGNRFVTLVTNLLYGVRLRDMETCYKMMTRRVAERLQLESRRFDVEAELTAKILRQGCTIVEVPIHYHARHEQKKLTPLDGLPTLRALLKYRFWRPSQYIASADPQSQADRLESLSHDQL